MFTIQVDFTSIRLGLGSNSQMKILKKMLTAFLDMLDILKPRFEGSLYNLQYSLVNINIYDEIESESNKVLMNLNGIYLSVAIPSLKLASSHEDLLYALPVPMAGNDTEVIHLSSQCLSTFFTRSTACAIFLGPTMWMMKSHCRLPPLVTPALFPLRGPWAKK